MAYWQWGDPANQHVVVCVHGLTRQGRDFDVLARELSKRYRVVCPDVVGRGQSDWLEDPMGYQIPVYVADMSALMAKLDAKVFDWVGTSMGGIIGMVVAGQPGLPLAAPIRKLVLNDVGPAIEWSATQRIGTYVGKPVSYKSLDEAAAAMALISLGFGPHSPDVWRELSRHMIKPGPQSDGSFVMHYDPAIGVPFRSTTQQAMAEGEAMLWKIYDNIKADTLLVRGGQSDLLTPATAEAMTQRGPKARLVSFDGVGHAPTLIAPDQLAAVTSFLN